MMMTDAQNLENPATVPKSIIRIQKAVIFEMQMHFQVKASECTRRR